MTEPLTIEQEPQQLNALVRLDANPAYLMRHATDVAGVSRDIVMKTAIGIQGRKYVKVEGWQAIAIAHGCAGSSREVEKVEGGVRAIGEVRRMSDGALIATAEGFVGADEPTWFGGEVTDKFGKTKTLPKRPDYAIRAMAQTRAISRACRSAFAHVVVLIDANLATTPAEEMPFDEPAEPAKPAKAPPRATGATPKAAPAATGKPFKTREQLVKLLEPHKAQAVLVLQEANVLMPNETLTDWPEDKLPQTPDQLNRLLDAIKRRVDGEPAEGMEIQPSGEPWRDMLTPFATGDVPKGTRFGDLPKNKLWFWCQKWVPRPYNGVISESDKALRSALNKVDEKYFNDRKQAQPELPPMDPNEDPIPF